MTSSSKGARSASFECARGGVSERDWNSAWFRKKERGRAFPSSEKRTPSGSPTKKKEPRINSRLRKKGERGGDHR